MNPLETYLKEVRDIRATGAATEETSYYPPLANLLSVWKLNVVAASKCD
jgi:hypothetical protein